MAMVASCSNQAHQNEAGLGERSLAARLSRTLSHAEMTAIGGTASVGGADGYASPTASVGGEDGYASPIGSTGGEDGYASPLNSVGGEDGYAWPLGSVGGEDGYCSAR